MNLHKVCWLARNYLSGRPIYLIQFVTARCNSRCKMCFYWKNIDSAVKEKELTLEEFEKIAGNFPGLQQVSIGGGEPFLRDDLPEICEIFSRVSNAQTIVIPTNGSMPDKICSQFEKILRKCPRTFFRLSLSIDGIGERHDKIRGTRGGFEKVLQTYEKLRQLRDMYKNFNIDVITVLSFYNQDRIKEIFEYVANNMEIDNHFMNLARGSTRQKDAKNVDIRAYAELLRWQESRQGRKENRPFSSLMRALYELSAETILKTAHEQRMVVPCVAGKRMLVIGEYGDVYQCEILSTRLGNMREAGFDLKKILNSDETKRVLDIINNKGCFCTFECAINASVVFNPWGYPVLFAKAIRKKFGLQKGAPNF